MKLGALILLPFKKQHIFSHEFNENLFDYTYNVRPFTSCHKIKTVTKWIKLVVSRLLNVGSLPLNCLFTQFLELELLNPILVHFSYI